MQWYIQPIAKFIPFISHTHQWPFRNKRKSAKKEEEKGIPFPADSPPLLPCQRKKKERITRKNPEPEH
jgi:hypothetical protein